MICGINLFTSLNGQNLLGNHRQHLKINAVELVKTRPGTARCQTLEKIRTIQLCSKQSQTFGTLVIEKAMKSNFKP